MKQITLNIPDREYDFFINLMKKFNFIKIKEADFIIPEEHKEEVRKRRKAAGENDFIKWDDAKKAYEI